MGMTSNIDMGVPLVQSSMNMGASSISRPTHVASYRLSVMVEKNQDSSLRLLTFDLTEMETVPACIVVELAVGIGFPFFLGYLNYQRWYPRICLEAAYTLWFSQGDVPAHAFRKPRPNKHALHFLNPSQIGRRLASNTFRSKERDIVPSDSTGNPSLC